MRQHRALRQAGRAAGVLQQRDIVDGDATIADFIGNAGGSFAAPHRRERDRPRPPIGVVADEEEVDESALLELLGFRQKRRPVRGHEHAGARILELVGELALRLERAHVDRPDAGLHAGEEGDRVVGRVRQVQPDGRARPDAAGKEGRGETVDLVGELAIADGAVAEVEDGPLGRAGKALVEQRRHGRDLDRRIPGDARRIGLLPGEGAAGIHVARIPPAVVPGEAKRRPGTHSTGAWAWVPALRFAAAGTTRAGANINPDG